VCSSDLELSVLEQAVGGGVGAPPQVGGEREGGLRVRSAAAELGRAGGGVGDRHGARLALGGAGGVHELAGVLVGAVGAPVDGDGELLGLRGGVGEVLLGDQLPVLEQADALRVLPPPQVHGDG